MRKFVLSLASAVAVTLGSPLAANAQLSYPRYVAPLRLPATVAFNLYKKQMIDLREEALALQDADGGTLTPAHRQKIQRRIDHIEYIFHRRLEDRNLGRL